MGSAVSKLLELADKFEDQATIPVPLGHVPYSPSLPDAMGSLAFDWLPIEWWYYGGWAKDTTGTKEFSILLFTLKVLVDAGTLFGVGMKDSSRPNELTYISKTHEFGIGEFPKPTSKSWSTTVRNLSGATMSCQLTGGTLGLSGATYQLDFEDKESGLQVALRLESRIGLMLESQAGALPKIPLVQYGMPIMSIQKGSTIIMNGETIELAEGNIWLERQSLMPYNVLKPIYIGNWLAITMNDGTCYTISFYWEKKKDQWISGTQVNYPPINQTALEYPIVENWSKSGPIQGSRILAKEEFDLNILNPSNPADSPHCTPRPNGNTYCTAWNLKLKGSIYKVKALIPNAEIFLMTYFYEGSASIHDEKNTVVGHAVVEQMGYD